MRQQKNCERNRNLWSRGGSAHEKYGDGERKNGFSTLRGEFQPLMRVKMVMFRFLFAIFEVSREEKPQSGWKLCGRRRRDGKS